MPRKKNQQEKLKGFQSSDDYEMEPDPKPNKTEQNKFSSSKNLQTTLSISNKFTQLNDFPPLPYSQIVQEPTTQNIISNSKQKEPTTKIPTQSFTKSAYITKTEIENVYLTNFTIPQSPQIINSINQKTFPKGCEWIPENRFKTQRFYEFILVDSNSVEIQHIKDSSEKIIYSKCIFKKIISSVEWGDPYAERIFSKRFFPQNYSYYDYKMAWYRAFLFRPFDHSWFFIFDKYCPKKYPMWFYHWWYLFGPTPQIYPKECNEGFTTFVANSNYQAYETPVMFHAEFKIPWILCWSYCLKQHLPRPYPYSLIREFKIKWWDKFTLEICSTKNVISFFQTGIKMEYQSPSTTNKPSPSKATSNSNSPQHNKNPKVESPNSESLSKVQKAILKKILEDPQYAKKILSEESSDEILSEFSNESYDPTFGGPFAQDPYDF
ncbi:MAG TPA: hypothetical protein VFT71_09245 [Candidatus Nitrosocosmicus sp.]|nr:hypothetical protein [Candidatus Nitrosocosmicus sp.]